MKGVCIRKITGKDDSLPGEKQVINAKEEY